MEHSHEGYKYRLQLGLQTSTHTTPMAYNNTSNTNISFATDEEALAWAYASSQSQSSTSTSTPQGGSHHAPVQIVLEPAESQNESGEGSGQDDLDNGRKRYASSLEARVRSLELAYAIIIDT